MPFILPCILNCFQRDVYRLLGRHCIRTNGVVLGVGLGTDFLPTVPRKHLQETDPCLFQGRNTEVPLNSHHQPREVRKDYWNMPRCKAYITPLSDLEGSG